MNTNFSLHYVSTNVLVPLTNFLNDNATLSSTFEEKIEFADQGQMKLTFSMMKYFTSSSRRKKGKILNPNVSLLHFGAQIEYFDGVHTYVFFITEIAPKIHKDNIRYDYVCQDEISFQWSRRNLGMSYSTVEKGGVRSIYTIATEVMQDAKIEGWRAVPDEFNEIETGFLTDTLITLEIENSNPYNIIIEACNVLNATLIVNWSRKIISFIQKDKIKFKGFRYYPETNLQSLDVNANINEMNTIMHVHGGTNEYDQNISIFPAMPQEIRSWWLDNYTNYQSYEEQIDWDTLSLFKSVTYNVWLDKFLVSNLESGNVYRIIIPDNQYSAVEIQFNTSEHAVMRRSTIDNQVCWYADIVFNISNSGLASYEIVLNDTSFEYKEVSYITRPEVINFMQIAQHMPALGNFLYDFSFFKLNNKLSNSEYTRLLNIFNKQMAYHNMWLKCLEPTYWQLYSELYLKIQEAKNILENKRAAYASDAEAEQENLYSQAITRISSLLKPLCSTSMKAESYDLTQERLFTKDIEILYQLYNEFRTYQTQLIYALNQLKSLSDYIKDDDTVDVTAITDPYQAMIIEGDCNYYLQQRDALYSMVGEASNQYKDPVTNKLAIYPQLLRDLYNAISEPEARIYDTIIEHRTANQNLWATVYREYGQYIYEGTYENSDELNSISLYNAAYTEFQQRKHPNAGFSLSVLDSSFVHGIGAQSVRPGDKIRVYNKELNLSEQVDAVNNLSYTNNELVVDTVSYELRTPEKVAITVQQIQSYKTILQKLIRTIN